MFNRASMKLGLDQAVLHPMTTSTKGLSESFDSAASLTNLKIRQCGKIIKERYRESVEERSLFDCGRKIG
jgi:hypothetical protein